MKRIFSLILCLVLVFPLISCASKPNLLKEMPTDTFEEKKETETAEPQKQHQGKFDPTGFCVGFGRADITPPKGTPMPGYGNAQSRLSENTLDPIFATCVAVRNGEETALIFSLDVLQIPRAVWNMLCRAVENATGVKKEFMIFNCSHTHCGPDMAADSPYMSRFLPRVVEAAKDAIATLDRAEMYVGDTRTENLAYVRRYIREDGTAGGGSNNVLGTNSPLARHETDADNQMRLIRFDRANQKDVLLVNWTCHVTTLGSSTQTRISSDFVGVFREETERAGNVYVSFLQGAAGNVTPGTKLSWEKNNALSYEQHGKDISAAALAALPTLTRAETGAIRALLTEEEVYYDNNVEGYDLARAREIYELFSQRKDTTALCIQYGFSSPYHASSVLSRASRTETKTEMNFGAIAIGDAVAFAWAPYEMFDTNGMQVKAASPFSMTFMCAYTNGAFGYIPSAEAFPNRGYEVDTTRFAFGTGEQGVRVLTGLLGQLKG
ncbi:MAG: hypothetical protein IKD18_04410 [Clostridia bacterium]|nr:hypothetical protein [Clostridia bacterium]